MTDEERQERKDRRKQYMKDYYAKNEDHLKEYHTQYYKENREKLKNYGIEYYKKKKQENTQGVWDRILEGTQV
jgi:hypothetical protein